jgi:hypothetical protein
MKKQKNYNPNDVRRGKCRECDELTTVYSATGNCEDCQADFDQDYMEDQNKNKS